MRLKASQDMKRKVAAVFVLTEPESQAVKAYYTLSATTVLLRDLPAQLQKKFPRYPALHATLIGRLAVDHTAQGNGIGRFLLTDALYRAWRHSGAIASMAVIIDAINEHAIDFYQHYHFRHLAATRIRCFCQ